MRGSDDNSEHGGRSSGGRGYIRHRASESLAALALVALLLGGCGPRGLPATGPLPTYPVVAPTGIPPLVGDGALAVVPADPDGGVVPVTADLGHDWRATALVRADRTVRLAVMIQGVDRETVEASGSLEPLVGRFAVMFSIRLYDADRGVPLDVQPAEMIVGVRPPPGVLPSSLAVLRFGDGTVPERVGALTADDARPALKFATSVPSTVALSIVERSDPVVTPLNDRGAVTDEAGGDPTAPLPVSDRAPLPARLRIGAIGVNAPIAPVGLEANGIMASPTEAHVVGWYELGPRPGESSNAIIAAHRDWNGHAGVFLRLADLAPGDTIEIQSGLGTRYRYAVVSVRSYDADDAPIAEVFGPTPGASLTLITCGGPFDAIHRDYLERVVVRAHGV